MRGVFVLSRAHLLTVLRERVTLFWFGIFPVFLFVVLALIFANVGQEGGMNFRVSLVNLEEDARGETNFAGIVEQVFTAVSKAQAGKEPLLTLYRPQEGEDKQVFLSRAKEKLRLGKIAAVIVIPAGFNREVMRRLTLSGDDPVLLTVCTNQAQDSSRMAGSIINEIVSRIDREFLIKSSRYDPQKEVKTVTEWTGKDESEVSYASFLLPGVILMAFFTAGIFGVPGTILEARDRHRLRRYWVTPLTVPQYLAGFSLGQFGLCLLQFGILWGIGRFGFGVRVNFARPEAVLFLLLSFFTFLSFGFFIASIAKTANGGMAIANIINMPMMFLSGLFFPVGDLPKALKAIVLVNPITYLASGLRASLGLGGETVSFMVSIIVPLAWIGLCISVAMKRFSWEAER